MRAGPDIWGMRDCELGRGVWVIVFLGKVIRLGKAQGLLS